MFFSAIAALVALAIPYIDPKIRSNKDLARAIGLVLFVHQVTSILQVALEGLPTMKMDPMSFNSFAMTGDGRLAQNTYAQFLHIVYSTFGPSHFLGCQVSNIFFSMALMIQVQLLVFLGYRQTLPKLILVFGLLPSCVLNTSVTLREAAQMFCYLAIALVLVRTCREGFTSRTLLLIPVSLMLVNLHQGMAALVVTVIPLSLAFALQARPAVLASLLIVMFSGGILVKDKVLEALSEKSATLQHLSAGNVEYFEKYAENVGESRTSFGVSLDLSSPGGALKTAPRVIFYYLFSPLPWQIRGMLDLVGTFESALRIALCVFAVQTLRQSSGSARREQFLLGFLFFVIEIAWAVGTSNWGTALRHRLVAWGILVAIGGALFGEKVKTIGEVENLELDAKRLSPRARRRALTQRKRDHDAP